MDQADDHFPTDPRDLRQLGFKSHATEYIGQMLSLDQRFIKNPPSTFFWWIEGGEHRILGLKAGDLAIVDKSLPPRHSSLAVYIVGKRHFVRRIRDINGILVPVSLKNPCLIDPLANETIWGVIRGIFREFDSRSVVLEDLFDPRYRPHGL